MKIIYGLVIFIFSNHIVMGQQLGKMQWFNAPEKWEITDQGKTLKMYVPAQTDYWRITHYGFTVDDAPFYYDVYGGEFEVKVKLSADYKSRYDQMGLMLRVDHENWIKTGIEYVDGKYNISAVVTHKTSDWSVIELDNKPAFIWVKAIRRLDAVEIFYSYDDKKYTMMRMAYLQDNIPVMIGLMGASPDGDGFNAKFEQFKITHLPDKRRLEWLKNNQ